MVAPVKVRRRKNSNGSIGWRQCRSRATKAPSETIATPTPARIGHEDQPAACASITDAVSASSATIASACPVQSFCVSIPGAAATHRNVSQIPAKPMGRFTRKMPRHPPSSTKTPPNSGPAASPTVPAAVHQPIPLARNPASSPQARLSSARLLGTRAAAPAPWSMRAAIKEPVAGCQAAQRRRGGEQREPQDEHPAMTDAVTQRAGGQQQRGERQGI